MHLLAESTTPSVVRAGVRKWLKDHGWPDDAVDDVILAVHGDHRAQCLGHACCGSRAQLLGAEEHHLPSAVVGVRHAQRHSPCRPALTSAIRDAPMPAARRPPHWPGPSPDRCG
jgi:hypothetical protein